MPLRIGPRPLDPAALRDSAARALRRRAPLLADGSTDAFRLLNGAGDGAPGLVVDAYGPLLVAHVTDARVLPPSAAEGLLRGVPTATSLYRKVHPPSARQLTDGEREELAPAAPLAGVPRERVVASENGRRSVIRPGAGLSVGLFLDMREVRVWVAGEAAGRRVLNLFAYTCAFGVAASIGGADFVLNVDASRGFLRWGQENYRENRLSAEGSEFRVGDAAAIVSSLGRAGRQFDLAIVDPPTFGSAGTRSFSVQRDLGRLAAGVAHLLIPDALLVVATNHHELSRRWLETTIAGAIDRPAALVGAWHEPLIDFPRPPHASSPLKVAAFRIA